MNWRSASTDAVYFNITNPDPVLAKIFDTAEFRQAASIAINRTELNDLVWNGLGEARQASPVKGSPEYDAELEKMWAEYDPKTANELLDKARPDQGLGWLPQAAGRQDPGAERRAHRDRRVAGRGPASSASRSIGRRSA